jgi:hypothetical protein
MKAVNGLRIYQGRFIVSKLVNKKHIPNGYHILKIMIMKKVK